MLRMTGCAATFAIVLILGLGLGIKRDAASKTDQTPVHPAAEFVASLGVNVHMAYAWTSYGDERAVQRSLEYLGIRHVRDVLVPWEVARPKYEFMAAAGFKFDFVIPVIDQKAEAGAFAARVSELAHGHPGSVSAVEGPNEVNIWNVRAGEMTGLPAAAQVQKDLHADIRSRTDLDQVPIYNLTLAYTDEQQFRALGALQPPADFANSHAYVWSWGTPAEGLPYLIRFAKFSAPDKPVVITETGYTVTPSDDYSGVTEYVQAVRTLQTYLDAFALGVKRTYLYELLDTERDPERKDSQKNFGLFRFDGTAKPAADGVRNLVSLLSRADGKSYANSGAARVAVEAPDDEFAKRLLFRREDGALCLILWYESPLRAKGGGPLKGRERPFRLTFDRARPVTVARVLDRRQLNPAMLENSLELQVGNEPLMVVFGD